MKVILLKKVGQLRAGSVCGMDVERAKKLVDEGKAVYHDSDNGVISEDEGEVKQLNKEEEWQQQEQ